MQTHTRPAPVRLPEVMLPLAQSAEQVYDFLMHQIEPELTTTVLPTLKEQYKNETPEQKKARGRRYKEAYAAYDKAYASYQAMMREKVRSYKRQSMQEMEEKDRGGDRESLATLETALSSAA